MKKRLIISILALTISVVNMMAEGTDSLGQWSLQASANVSYVFNNDDGMKELLHSHAVNYYDVRAMWRSGPDTKNPYDKGLGRPYIMGGLMYADYSRLNIRREERDYNSHIEQIITAYGGVKFDVLHAGRWTLDVDLRHGIGYCPHPYNERKNRDQELIGSQFSIYIAGGLHIGYRISPHWSVSGGVDLQHYSNGTLDRPNIGANTGGATVAVRYDFKAQELSRQGRAPKNMSDDDGQNDPHWPWRKGIYLETTAGVALKALRDNFDVYHHSHNPLYASFTTVVIPMWRYHRLHATGIGIDYTYANYVYKLRDFDEKDGCREPSYSPHIIGVSLHHEVFYRHLSVNVGAGVYLNRKTGHGAVQHESMLYQNVGLRYSLPFTKDRLFIGYNVKAHNFSKVDCVQFLTGYRFNL